MIEQDSSRKRFFIVAFRTIRPEIPLVHIIRSMTAVTVRRHVIFLHFSSVTAIARVLRMGTTKREISLFGMIEFRGLPFRGGMACTALLAESSGMDVIARVAAGTVLGKLTFTRWLDMTCGTARLTVCTGQRETTLPLVIEALLEPRIRLVAVRAPDTELALM